MHKFCATPGCVQRMPADSAVAICQLCARLLAAEDSLGDAAAFPRPERSRVALWDEGERRMEQIGPNGPAGEHYDIPSPSDCAMTPRQWRVAEEAALGRKADAEKPRLDLLVEGMPRALEEVARVLTFGSQKYADHNWQHVDRAQQRYLAAGMRHELALAAGEARDPETGLHHLAHKLCCDLFRLELALREGEA